MVYNLSILHYKTEKKRTNKKLQNSFLCYHTKYSEELSSDYYDLFNVLPLSNPSIKLNKMQGTLENQDTTTKKKQRGKQCVYTYVNTSSSFTSR